MTDARILVVEDSPTQAEALRFILESRGFEVDTSPNGAAALEKLRDGHARFGLVISDVLMPGLSGYELCKQIKTDRALTATPVFLLTALSDPMDIIKGLECGADSFLTKPYQEEQLVSRVRGILEQRRLRREGKIDAGLEVYFLGKKFSVTSDREQILGLLVSTFEDSVRTNRELRAREEELRRANLELEARSAELARAKAQAERESRFKSRFLAGMSHELRTPLNSVLGFSELLLDGIAGDMNETQRSYVDHVLTSGRHLLSLISDILDLSKIEAGRMELHREGVWIGALVEQVRANVTPMASKRGVTLEVEVPEADVEIALDRVRMAQVLYNLLSNGIKFTPEGGKVRVEARFEERVLVVVVSDTGIGIKPEDMPKLFREFVQLEQSTGSKTEGTGLGLVLTKRLVELHGGTIEVSSELGKGTQVTLRMPAVTAGAGASEVAPPMLRPSLGPASGPYRVLVVEDDAASRRLVRDLLAHAGHKVHEATRVEEAFEAIPQANPDVVLVDLQITGGGERILRRLRGDPLRSHVPVLAVTALAMEGDKERILQSGFDGYVGKPIDTRTFTKEIERWVRG